jgi:ankyrin repeat protein
MIEGYLALAATLTLLTGAGPADSELLFAAVRDNDFAAVRMLLADNPELVKARDAAFGATPLHWAAAKGHVAVATLLVVNGSDLRAVNLKGETPLTVAKRQRHTTLLPVLRPPDSQIISAVKLGDFDLVQRHLEKEPDALNQTDAEYGGTPLHWAAFKGHDAIAALLISMGANVGALNSGGRTPLAIALATGHAGVARLLNASEPLIIRAVRSGDIAAVEELLTVRPRAVRDADAKSAATALHWAAFRGQARIARYLLTKGADPQARNAASETPLDVARRAGWPELVVILSESAE